MDRTGRGRLLVLVTGVALQLAVWLVVRPDRAGARWTDGTAATTWMALEGLLAVLIGVLAPDRHTVVVTVVTGWGVQMLHLAVLGEHYDDTLWAIGLFLDVVLAAAALALALLSRLALRRDRRRIGT